MGITISNSGKTVTIAIRPIPDSDRFKVSYNRHTKSYTIFPHLDGYKMSRTKGKDVGYISISSTNLKGLKVHERLHFPLDFDTRLCIDAPESTSPRKKFTRLLLSPPQPHHPFSSSSFSSSSVPPTCGSHCLVMIEFKGKPYSFNVPEGEMFDLLLAFTRNGYSAD